ncbi:ABC transporter substrate-binding protein [Nocardia sp. NBC_00508]|uniref:peptide ABC transporter substrate-binding protein n=1 Tax=Nocardia sp. NBC_00508 TaxID=2975992 RepID=UPI002E8084A5|nr:ABC transporter substrate-binding protein [Nocardia sp. NBC_00508]WUD66296.1 ABC transporter substrate-binding protein [Nocardia sp. NBC_00508]
MTAGRTGRVVLLVAALLAALLTGCGDTETGPNTISYNGTEPANPLIPGDTTESGGVKVIGALFRGLVEYDPRSGEPRNAVADRIDTDDARVYRITLRRGWTFHDGSPVTARSFVDAWNYTAYAPNGQHGAAFLSHIDGFDLVNPADPDGSGPLAAPQPSARDLSGLRVVDDLSFVVMLSAPFSAFPTQLGYAAFFPLPASFFRDRAAYERHPVGNGPFRFVSREPGRNIVLTRFDRYRGQRPRIPGVEFRFYPSLEAAYADVVAEKLDFLEITPASALAGGRYKAELAGRHVSQTYLGIQSISFPLYDRRYADPRLRRALSMAIDRQYVIDRVFGGDKQVADGLIPPQIPGRIAGQCGELCTYQPLRAKELFDATGFSGPIELTSNNDSANQEWMEATCRTVTAALGRECRFVPVATLGEFRTMIDTQRIPGIYRSGWVADYPAIENFLNPMYRTGAAVNGGRYSNPEVDALLAQADAAPTEQQAFALYQQAERKILADMPAIPFWFQTVQSGWSHRLRDVVVTPFRELDLISVTLNGD